MYTSSVMPSKRIVRRCALVASLATLVACGDGNDNERTATPHATDLSVNLTDFALDREPALGFCPPPDEVFRVRMSRGNDGVYRLRLSVLDTTPHDGEAC